MKNIITTVFSVSLIIFTSISCSIETDLDVENNNNGNYKKVLSNVKDLEKILESSYLDMLNMTHSTSSLFYLLNADQITSTNKARDFWGFSFQPRKIFGNFVGYDGENAAKRCWQNGYSAIKGANHIVRWIEGEKKPFISGKINKRDEALASAYLIKGISEGYLSMTYDNAYILDYNTSLTEASKKTSYVDMAQRALKNIDKAIEIASNSKASFSVPYMVSHTMNKELFIQFANSMAARILISVPRTKAEAKKTDFSKVLSYANKGITSDFMIPTKVGVWYSYVIDWATYVVSGAGYLPVDQKIIHLIDPEKQPKDYPKDKDKVLPAIVSNDKRVEKYLVYRGGNFGYLNPTRDRSLFSSYSQKRWYNNNDLNQEGYQNPVLLKAEIDYIKAEATLKTSGAAAAVAIMDQSVRKIVGKMSTGNTYSEVLKALHYEYSFELNLAGGGHHQWAFMRRNDLLQKGAFTMMPIPASELEAQGVTTTYSFGGVNNVGKKGTASTDGWKDDSSYNE